MLATKRMVNILTHIEKTLSADNWCKGVLTDGKNFCLIGHVERQQFTPGIYIWLQKNISSINRLSIAEFNDSCESVEEVRALVSKTIADMRTNNKNRAAINKLYKVMEKVKKTWGENPGSSLDDYLEGGSQKVRDIITLAYFDKTTEYMYLGNVIPALWNKEQVVTILEDAINSLII